MSKIPSIPEIIESVPEVIESIPTIVEVVITETIPNLIEDLLGF